jgi:pyruvate dehydrogenase E2 component (dihydrolipoamide acetyltransferase)
VISEVVMPQMGADMEEGTVVRWLKREGDAVERGEIIAEIETDKANVEIEAFDGGIFRKILVPEGTTVPVGQVIAVIASPEEDISRYEAEEAEAVAATAGEAAPTRRRPEPAPAPAPAEPTPIRPGGRLRASPVARRVAEDKGVDLARVQGTGPEGRILRRDVEAFLARLAATPAAEAKPAAAGVTVATSRMRQTIARRMSQSKREAPHYYVTMDIDMTEAERLRRQVNEDPGFEAHVSVNDVIVKAVALALARHPIFNAWFVDGEVRQQASLNIGIAIALEGGLIAPALLDCGRKSLLDIAAESRSLAERARSGVLKAEEYTGATFTVTNLGMYEVETLIGIISPPQTAILGVGAVQSVPVVRDGEVVVREMMKVALSADHRVTDGAQGATFLKELKDLLQSPFRLLV